MFQLRFARQLRCGDVVRREERDVRHRAREDRHVAGARRRDHPRVRQIVAANRATGRRCRCSSTAAPPTADPSGPPPPAMSCEFGRFWNWPMPPLICPRDPRCAPSKPPICGFVPYVQLKPSRGLTYTPRGTASLRWPKTESIAGLNADCPGSATRRRAAPYVNCNRCVARYASPSHAERAEVVAEAAIDLQAAREARRHAVLEILNRVVRCTSRSGSSCCPASSDCSGSRRRTCSDACCRG